MAQLEAIDRVGDAELRGREPAGIAEEFQSELGNERSEVFARAVEHGGIRDLVAVSLTPLFTCRGCGEDAGHDLPLVERVLLRQRRP